MRTLRVLSCVPADARDFLWMYPALVLAPLFVILLTGIQERAMAGRKRFGGLAVAFGAMAATLLTADYFLQLRVIQPAVLKGESRDSRR